MTAPVPSPVWPDDATIEPETPHAPAWVMSVTPAAIVDQRQRGWPNFHPEDFCHVCGHRNPVWSAPLDVWSAVFDGDGGIVCPSCFATLHDASTGHAAVWWFTTWPPVAPDPSGDTKLLAQVREIVYECIDVDEETSLPLIDASYACRSIRKLAALLAGES